jgi:hypothetical protein
MSITNSGKGVVGSNTVLHNSAHPHMAHTVRDKLCSMCHTTWTCHHVTSISPLKKGKTDKLKWWQLSFGCFCASTVMCPRQLISLSWTVCSRRQLECITSSVKQTLACQSTMLPKHEILALEVCKELLARAMLQFQFIFHSLSVRLLPLFLSLYRV